MTRSLEVSRMSIRSIWILLYFFAPLCVFGATSVYYAVGQNTNDHKTGSPTVTISGNTATFSVAQTATNMGVGDRVTWGNVGVGYITGKTSTSVWSISTAIGGTPTATTSAPVNSIAHPFASLNAAIGNGVTGNATSSNFLNTSNLVSGDYILNIPVYFDSGADATSVTINGYTTGASNYIRVYTATSTTSEVNQSQRHSGVFTTSKYYLTSPLVASSTSQFLKFDGLQFRTTSATANNNIRFYSTGGGVIEFTNNIVKGVLTGGSSGYGLLLTNSISTSTLKAYNNLFLGWVNSSVSSAAFRVNQFWDTYIYNNTIYNTTTGISRVNGNIIAKNNLFASTTQPASGTFLVGTDYNAAASSSMGYTVTGGGNTHDRVSQTFSFVDVSNDNFHLSANDLGALNFGVNLSADATSSFATDFDGESRPSGASWDIGADERDVVAPIISSVASSTAYTTATVTWSTDELATSTVEYGTTQSYGTASSSSIFTTSPSISLTGLSADTTYYFRVSSGDVVYNYATSSQYTLRTLPPDTTPPTQGNLGVITVSTPIGSTALTLNWTKATDNISAQNTLRYEVRQSSTNNIDTVANAELNGSVILSYTTDIDTFTVTGLSTSTTYYFNVIVKDEFDNKVAYVMKTTSTSGTTISANSCSLSDVVAAIGVAVSGNEVSVPAGNCTWTSSMTIPDNKTITLAGAGVGVTNITLDSVTSPMINFGISDSNLTGFTFIGNNRPASGGIWFSVRGDGGWRIHHNAFTNTQNINNICFYINGGTGIPSPIGLIDNNTFTNCRPYIEADVSSDFGAYVWSQPSGLGGSNFTFIEDNTFNYSLTQGNCIDAQYGGRYVARFNTVTGCPFEAHSATNGHATRAWEIYNNTWAGTGSNSSFATFLRGGSGIAFSNTFASGYSQTLRFDEGRVLAGLGGIWTICDGTAAIDGNTITTGNPGAGYPCRDQLGRGMDASLFVSGSTPYPSQASEPIPVFLNRKSGIQAVVSVVNGTTDYIQDGRDYQNETSSFDGTIGIGIGLSANKPATCTIGVYYWATDEGEWNSSQVGVDGRLYKCTNTNTWSLYYTPYTYPHPTRNVVTSTSVSSGGSSIRLRRAEEEALAQVQTIIPSIITTHLATTTVSTSSPLVITTTLTPNLREFIDLLISIGVIPPEKALQARTIVSAPSATIYSFTRNLQLRDTGTDVKNLQSFLVSKGFLTATPNGIFGPQTYRALKEYQTSRGIPATGYFGPLTRGSVGR